jgi:hypothetical protein
MHVIAADGLLHINPCKFNQPLIAAAKFILAFFCSVFFAP